jgi:exodeoxyribonuclease VII large subunit
VITGIGHEVDESLCDLAADVVASTPSNAAQMLTKDRHAIAENVKADIKRINNLLNTKIDEITEVNRQEIVRAGREILRRIELLQNDVSGQRKILEQLNPEQVLERGYALIRGDVAEGNEINILTAKNEIEAKITKIKERKNG